MAGCPLLKIFLDTAALIDLLAGNARAISSIDKLRVASLFYTSPINIYEVLCGISILKSGKEKEMQALSALLANITVLSIDSQTACLAAEIYCELRSKGKPINEPDYLIAASAISNGIFTLITQNKKPFENIPAITSIITY